MPSSLILPRFTQVDAYGNPLVGGKLYTYANLTTTPQTTYKDAAGTIANTNPIILDSLGSAVIFLAEGVVYTFVMKDASDALIWSQDNVSGASGTSSGSIPTYPTVPIVDVGSPVYVPGIGWLNWDGSKYVADYSIGFSGGAYSYRNKFINADFVVWDNGNTVGPIVNNDSITVNRWRVVTGPSASITVTRQTSSTDYGPERVGENTARLTSNAAVTPGASDKNRFLQKIEGQNLLQFALGSLWGGAFTLSFWVKGSIAGTYSVAFLNGGSPSYRSYISTYTIDVAGAWEFKSITVPIDQNGLANWNRTTGIGLQVIFDLGSGSNSEAVAGVWGGTESTRVSGSVRLIGTNAATWEIGSPQLEYGGRATPFELLPVGETAQLCKRYSRNIRTAFQGYGTAGMSAIDRVPLAPPMRATPSIAGISTISSFNRTSASFNATVNYADHIPIATAAGVFASEVTFDLNAEL